MITIDDVEKYLIDLFGLLVLDDRGKNQQTLSELEITPSKRKEIITSLKADDYCEGPLPEKMRGFLPMWIFEKTIKGQEVYIKISMGKINNSAVYISFHIAEYSLSYPLK
jgi:hypothetical protein